MVYNQIATAKEPGLFTTFTDFFWQTCNKDLMKSWDYGNSPDFNSGFSFVKKVNKVFRPPLEPAPITVLRQNSHIYIFHSDYVTITELETEFQNIWV